MAGHVFSDDWFCCRCRCTKEVGLHIAPRGGNSGCVCWECTHGMGSTPSLQRCGFFLTRRGLVLGSYIQDECGVTVEWYVLSVLQGFLCATCKFLLNLLCDVGVSAHGVCLRQPAETDGHSTHGIGGGTQVPLLPRALFRFETL